MIADDLFAGAGGWDLAAQRLGIHARGVENMPQARATREAAGLATIHGDVWTYTPDGKASGLIASPPCQTFSSAGKGKGRKALDDVLRGIRDGYALDIDHLRFLGEEVGDPRTALVLTPLHYALTGGYDWLAWEQVPAVLPVWEACAAVLRDSGWHVWTGHLHAEAYGVPQTRKRAFLLAARSGPIEQPLQTHSRYHSRTPDRLDPDVAKWVTMAEALGWGLSGPDFIRMTTLPNSAQRSIHRPAPTMAFGHDAASCRWIYDRPATTVVGSFAPDIIAAPGYRTTVSRQNAPGSVRVTIHEAGILQSFPGTYPWQGAKGKQFLQAGNAVPPGLALHALGTAARLDARQAAA